MGGKGRGGRCRGRHSPPTSRMLSCLRDIPLASNDAGKKNKESFGFLLQALRQLLKGLRNNETLILFFSDTKSLDLRVRSCFKCL